ncbi:unnamed protein product [Wuchereria bancrofti]|uniref:Uncharacterized protein n=1 Tax=Wuchereria bancrofti TaxID=6293 RepID=A0A3P7DZC9_WUCBA|nr:unnamed protein product [Wuchereria bancrofti]
MTILLEFDLTNNGLIILGNLRGISHSLLGVFDEHGLPPKRHYLFLATLNNHTTGTDEASMARRCGFLRSNHEIMEAMNADNVPITSRQNLFSEVNVICAVVVARWSSSKGGTFRGLSNDGSNEDEHQQFIKTIYPNSHCLYDREPFSAYDLRLLDINMTGSDELMQQDERKRCAQRIQEFWHCLFCCFGNCRLTSREIEDEDEGIES